MHQACPRPFSCLVLIVALSVASNVRSAETDAEQLKWVSERVASNQKLFLAGPSDRDAHDLRNSIRHNITPLDSTSAIALLRKLRKPDAKDSDGLDFAYVQVAKACLVNKEYDQCRMLLQEALEAYPQPFMAGSIMLGFADLAAAENDSHREREWLERCLELDEATESKEARIDILQAKSGAHGRLATWHEKAGDFVRAYLHHESTSSFSSCGTGWLEHFHWRRIALRQCLASMSEHKQLVGLCLKDAAAGDDGFTREFIAQLYRDAGQLADLARIAKDFEQLEREKKVLRLDDGKNKTSAFLRECLAAETLRQQGDTDELLKQFMTETNSAKSYIAIALADCGIEGNAALRTALATAPIHDRESPLQALAGRKSPYAHRAIIAFAEGDAEFDNEYALVEYVADCGPNGIKALSRLAWHTNRKRAEAARNKLQFLTNYGRVKFEEATTNFLNERRSITVLKHNPAAGSLPRCLDEALKVELPRIASTR
jgi:hypothetical protein